MNFFLIFFKIITDGITDGISIGKSVGNKKYYYRRIYRRNEAGNFIFLFLTDKKLPIKESPTEHFRR